MMTKTKKTCIALLLVFEAVILSFHISHAQTNSNRTTFTARVKFTDTVQITSGAAVGKVLVCADASGSIKWQSGSAGPTGPTGVTGAVGSNGTNGTAGATGLTGADGVDGIDGATGPTGPTGPAGSNGTNGSAGVTGPTGPTGTAGTNGSNGSAGATGPTGSAGSVGATGPTGADNNITTLVNRYINSTNSSTSERAVYSVLIPGGTIGSTDQLRAWVHTTFASATTCVTKFYFNTTDTISGATQWATVAVNQGNHILQRSIYMTGSSTGGATILPAATSGMNDETTTNANWTTYAGVNFANNLYFIVTTSGGSSTSGCRWVRLLKYSYK